jgi:hypothetical protein
MKFTKRWEEGYRWLSQKSSFFSKGMAFLIVFFAIFSLTELVAGIEINSQFWRDYRGRVLTAGAFHLLIAFCFLGRFVLLFFGKKHYFWTAQLFWLLGFIGLYLYYAYTGQFYPRSSSCMDCMYFDTFLYASSTFVVLAGSYMLLGALKQIGFGMISLVLAFRKIRFDV